MIRELTMTFGTDASKYQGFEDVASDCTDEQIMAFADVCGTIVGSAINEIEINDSRKITFGTEA